MPEPGAVLRVFCAAPGRESRELEPVDTCPPGAQLAFAAGAEPPLSHVAVRALLFQPRAMNGSFAVAVESTEPQPDEVGQKPQPQMTPPPREEPWQHNGGPFLVGGRPGQEVPLEWTLRLPSTTGEVEMIAVFTSGPEAAQRGERKGGGAAAVHPSPGGSRRSLIILTPGSWTRIGVKDQAVAAP